MERALERYADNAPDDISHKVGVVGSFGCACEEMLRELTKRHPLEFVKFIKSPIDELVTYHRSRYGI